MANFLGHEGCPSCGSSDGRAMYDDGTSFCFVCEKYFKGDVEVATANNNTKDKEVHFEEVYPIDKPIRGISPKIFQQFSYGKTKDGVHVYNAFDESGRIVAQKLRYPDKTFRWIGSPKEAVPFGMNQWRSGGKAIYITEGELDALSIAEALGGKYPVISVNNGAGGAYKDLAKHLEFLDSYEQIVLAFDNDKVGQEAVTKVASLFKAGKVYVTSTAPYKDFNEVLQKEGKAGVLKRYYETKRYAPDGIVTGKALDKTQMLTFDSDAEYSYPVPSLNTKLDGLSKGKLVVITSGTGMGKTTFAREIAYDLLMNQKAKIGWVALEESIKRSVLGFIGLHINKRVNLRRIRKETPTEEIDAAYEEVIDRDDILFYDHFGSLESDNLLSKLRFLAVVEKVDFIFLDHISIVISGQDNNDERKAIDKLMTDMRSLVEETGVTVITISHLRKPSNDKGFENGQEITLSHLRGSGAIAQLSDTVLALERDQQAAEDSNIGTIRILKDREGGETGIGGRVMYNQDTGRLLPIMEEHEDFESETDEEEDY